MFEKSFLNNGLGIITASLSYTPSVGICVVVKNGPRYENSKIKGISHFLEHMCFRTRNWPSREALMRAVEGVGGTINAFTGRESTSFWIKTHKQHFEKASRIILDMVFYPRLDNYFFNKEKQGIIAQIQRRHDSPQQYIWDLLFKTIWPSRPLGQEGLGNKTTVNKLSLKALVNYYNQRFIPPNIVIAGGGDIIHTKVVNLVRQFLDLKTKLPDKKAKNQIVGETQKQARLKLSPRATKQVYLLLGIKAYSRQHSDRFVGEVLNSILGVGFSSRLYLNLREKNNLVFSPRSTLLVFQDNGLLTIQAETQKDKTKKAIEAIIEELKKLKKERIFDKELKFAKEKLKGRILFHLETPERLAEWYGLQALFQPEILTVKEVFKKIDLVTSEDTRRVAEDLFMDKNLNLAVIGPIENEIRDKIKKRLTFNAF